MASRKNPNVHVYALLDPRDQTPRYVGRSRSPMTRFYTHVSAGMTKYQGNNQRLYGWIESLAGLGMRPMLLLMERVAMADAPAAEQKWIDRFRSTVFNSTSNRTKLVLNRRRCQTLGYK